MYSVTAGVEPRSCSSALAIGTCGGTFALRCSSSASDADEPRELALHERDLVLPRVRHELDVLQVPVVVLDTDARRLRSCDAPDGRATPRTRRSPPWRDDVRLEIVCTPVKRDASCVEAALWSLTPPSPRSTDPCRCPTRFAFACSSSAGRSRGRRAISGAPRRKRKRVLPHLHRPPRAAPPAPADRSRREHRDVERRIVRPGPQHAMIEVEPVHLGADDVVVDLLRNRPAARIDRGQPRVAGELALLRRHRRAE